MNKQESLLWLGISMQKESKESLDEKFLSGKLIKKVIDRLPEYKHYKSNLVNYAPLDINDKLRYPTKNEIIESFGNLFAEIENIQPRLIIALGGLVTKSLSQMLKVDIVSPQNFDYLITKGAWPVMSVHHPSYMAIYKRKQINQYMLAIINSIKSHITLSR